MTEEIGGRNRENRENSEVRYAKTGGSNEVKFEVPERFVGGRDERDCVDSAA